MKILKFNEWQDAMLRDTPSGELVKCPVCHGESVVECFECGHEHDCDDCGGCGERVFGKLPEYEKRNVFNLANYHAQVENDIRALASYKGQNAIEMFVEAGASPYSRVFDSKLVIDWYI